MAKRSNSAISEKAKQLGKSALPLYLLCLVAGALVMGVVVRLVLENIGSSVTGGAWRFRAGLLIEPATWLIGAMVREARIVQAIKAPTVSAPALIW